MASPIDFVVLLKTYRKSMGWTQEETSKKWGFSLETISAWERGKRHPSNHDVPRLAKYLEVRTEDLAESIEQGRYIAGGRRAKVRRDEGKQAWKETFDTWGELTQIYRTRTEFSREFSYDRMFQDAQEIIACGISLNAISMSYDRSKIIEAIVTKGTIFQLSFLDPFGSQCLAREKEEAAPEGVISTLTDANIKVMKTIATQLEKLGTEHAGRLELTVYDMPPRFNIYIVNNQEMTVQHYAYGRGEETPTFVLRRQTIGGLFDFYAKAAQHILQQSQPLKEIIPTKLERKWGSQ